MLCLVMSANLALASTAPGIISTVSAIAPATGSPTGGTAVTLTGTGFTGATGVTFRGVAATNLVVVSPTSITATTPAGAVGGASVLVTTPGGVNAANSIFAYAAPALVTAQAVATSTLTANVAVTPFKPVTASGGLGALSYAVSPALPTGLSIASATGLISGTPTVLLAASTFTVTVSDSSQTPQTSFKTFALTIAIPPAPTVASIVPPLALHSVAPLWRSQALASRGPHVLRSVG